MPYDGLGNYYQGTPIDIAGSIGRGAQARGQMNENELYRQKMLEQRQNQEAVNMYNRVAQNAQSGTAFDQEGVMEDFQGSMSAQGQATRGQQVGAAIDAPRMKQLSNMALASLSIDDPEEQKEAFKFIHSQLRPEEQQRFGDPSKWNRMQIVSLIGDDDVKSMMEQWKSMRKSSESSNPKTDFDTFATGMREDNPRVTNSQISKAWHDIKLKELKIANNVKLDEKPLTGDTAGKLAMLSQASRDVEDAEKMLFVNGKLDSSKLAGGFFGLPTEQGREINSRIENAVAAKLRAETGAAAQESEVQNISRRFKPKPGLDDDAAARDKMQRLKEYLDEAAYYIDPKGLHRAGATRDRQVKGTAQKAAAPLIAINKKTGERRQSTDGGKTWRKI